MSDKSKKPKQTLTPAEQQMIQEEKDKQMAPKLESAYMGSLTSTTPPPSPPPPPPSTQRRAKGGVTRADGCITKGHTRGKMV
jgi:hypothetical protein